jgi:trans-2-enoyl-CoA reductase
MSSKSEQSAQIDALFEQFIYAGFPLEEQTRIRSASSVLDKQMQDAVDQLRGIMADREGKEALAKALREGLKHV